MPPIVHDQPVASAADATNADLLLRSLELANWDVELTGAACGYSGLAVQLNGGVPLRIVAVARTRDATVLLLFEQVRARLDERQARFG